jgi:glycosyltransferase involved in cell wall biosynthesis
MRILFLLNRLGRGGAQRLVLDTCDVLNSMKNISYKLVVFDKLNLYPEYMERIPVEICHSNVELSISGKNKINVSELQKIIDDFRPDVIHSHLFIPELISRSCLYPNAKWFSHLHDNMYQLKRFKRNTLFNKKLLVNYFERLYMMKRYKINGGNHFIAISKDTLNFAKTNLPEYNVTLLYNAINYERFINTNQKSVFKNNKIKLVNISSFQTKKNQKLLVDISLKMKSMGMDFELNLIGDGEDKEYIQELINNYNLENQIKIHGIRGDVETFLWDSDIYIHSATYEPFGLVLIEAMAAGLPVITLDGKGNRDIIEDGKNGYMIYEQDPELFIQKIKALKENEQLYNSISKYATLFAKNFDIKNYVNRLLNVYSHEIEKKTEVNS